MAYNIMPLGQTMTDRVLKAFADTLKLFIILRIII
jgi:hypothetical protein